MPGPFEPPALLRNRHLQSVLASLKLRRPFVRRRAKAMLAHSRPIVLCCGGDVRLMGIYSENGQKGRGLAVLIHGWEGSADSVYLVSAAGLLFEHGFDVFRLNLRDHGDTHHLNPGIFHCCRIDEVVEAVQRIQELFPRERMFLGGFSLGGNFCLRVAVRAPARGIRIDKVAAVSPALDPARAMAAIETGWPLYHAYFLRKWKKSLEKKRRLFPELADLDDTGRYRTLASLTDFITPRFTDFPDAASYYRGYAITGDALARLAVPAHIIASLDDPVIPAGDLHLLARNPRLTIEATTYGGHCGFLKNARLQSWAEERMAELFLENPAS
ncbi:MAG: alpha/beta fold hydrolase [Thermodesulfobacteriota bacterium]